MAIKTTMTTKTTAMTTRPGAPVEDAEPARRSRSNVAPPTAGADGQAAGRHGVSGDPKQRFIAMAIDLVMLIVLFIGSQFLAVQLEKSQHKAAYNRVTELNDR